VTDAVCNLDYEQETDEYNMVSNLFEYNTVKNDPNFALKRYKDSLFKGTVIDKKRSGLGAMVYRNGRLYEGEWLNDQRNGKGYERFIDGGCYTGQYKDNKAHGKGVFTWKNGEIYDGEFDSGLKHGFGIWKGV